jgi:hypothetical protein
MPDETPTVVVMPDADEAPTVGFSFAPEPRVVLTHMFSPPSLTIYMPPGVEFVRADGDGKVFVRGTLVDSAPEVYRALREFLNLPEWAKP